MSLPTEKPMAPDPVTRFFGGPPLSVLFRLALISILVGVVLEALGFDPWNILDSLRQLDWASRDMRRRHKQVEAATRELAATLQRNHCLVGAARRGPGLDRALELGLAGPPPGGSGEFRIGGEIGTTDHSTQRLPDGIAGDRDQKPPLVPEVDGAFQEPQPLILRPLHVILAGAARARRHPAILEMRQG